jgi:hypothetical protein
MSYRIVDQIKKSNLPRPLKTVLESYVRYGNRDGTSIRPTEAKVGIHASISRGTVSRHTQTLVTLGLLVHDLDEHGIWMKHAYNQPGVWAYVYHVDASKLKEPALMEQWEKQRIEHLEKCKVAGAKNTHTKWAKGKSGNPSGMSNIQQQEHRDLRHPSTGICDKPSHRDLRQTLAQGFTTNPTTGIYDTDPTLVDPCSAPPTDDPSARNRAVDQKRVSELVSEDVLDLPDKSNQPTNQPTNLTEATPPQNLFENQNPNPTQVGELGFFDDGEEGEVWDYQLDRLMTPEEKETWTREHLKECWHRLRPTAEDLRLMYEVCKTCESNTCFPENLVAYAKVHHTSERTKGMVPRDPKSLWNAVCGPRVNPNNGLIAQFKECGIEPCRKCLAEAKREAAAHG